LLAISKSILKPNNLEFEWLKPLIQETVTKSLAIGPENAQTGPAARGDMEVLDRHMAFLQSDEKLAQLYQLLSQHIVDAYVPPETE
jgi:predicted short-subunit dehydrogenase-like oxidoreductase (DUF2520 family)